MYVYDRPGGEGHSPPPSKDQPRVTFACQKRVDGQHILEKIKEEGKEGEEEKKEEDEEEEVETKKK